MNNPTPRLCAVLPVLLLAAGCASNLETSHQPATTPGGQVAAGGRVSLSGSGHLPPYPQLQLQLRHEAARQFGVPDERIVLGPIETDGVKAMESGAQFMNSSAGTVQLPPGYAEEQRSGWSASASVSVKPPAEG